MNNEIEDMRRMLINSRKESIRREMFKKRFKYPYQIRKSPEWKWYEERLSLVDNPWIRKNFYEKHIINCLLGKHLNLQHWEEELEQIRLKKENSIQVTPPPFPFEEEN